MNKDLDERIRALAEALRSGVKLIIINRGDTPFDSYTHLRFFKEIGDLLPPVLGLLKQLMGLGDRGRTRNPRLVDGEPQ